MRAKTIGGSFPNTLNVVAEWAGYQLQDGDLERYRTWMFDRMAELFAQGIELNPGIGGVLEPLQAEPVIVEDDCFIGARSEVAEGVIVRKGAVLSMGVFLGASTKIVDRETGEIFVGEVPEYAVVVPGTLPAKPLKNGQPGPATACAVIVKRVDERTRAKTSINELLRD